MTGTPSQIEWAEQIKHKVSAEFERVAAALRSAAENQSEARRNETGIVLAILEEKRIQVLSEDQAGYFIREWQELGDQVRQMITDDVRHKTMRSRRVQAGLDNRLV